MGSVSIDFSVANLWRIWRKFQKGKQQTKELDEFTFSLEQNLFKLSEELQNRNYRHGKYRTFTVTDNKRRTISVAPIKDRIVHRLIYEYLMPMYDKTFIYDVWSCRKGKGLLGAVLRTQQFLTSYQNGFVWRTDIKKFFDNVDHETLLELIKRRVADSNAFHLIQKVVASYDSARCERERVNVPRRVGIPIGNLTSQIFANIYLNELDRFVKHCLKPLAYLRYGDDFIMLSDKKEKLLSWRERVAQFLRDVLMLEINYKNDILVKACWGLRFLGCHIFPKGRRLNKRNWQRAKMRLDLKNLASYGGLINQNSKEKKIKEFQWFVLEKFDNKL